MSDLSVTNIKFRVQRYDPERDSAPHMQEFTVPVSRGMTVLDGLLYIKENLDSTLAFRTSCRMGICGSCAMIVNDYPHLACHTQIEEFESDTLTVRPLHNMPIIKDLVPALDSVFAKHTGIKPYIIRSDKEEMEHPTREYGQSPDQIHSWEQFAYCIKCGICVAACPTSASDPLFLGPQALAQVYRYCADSRDDGGAERLPLAGADHGAWNCHFAAACSEACPKGLDPGMGIQLLKRMLAAKALGGKKKKPAQVVPEPAQIKEKVAWPEFTVDRK